jgi:hypothetical protein
MQNNNNKSDWIEDAISTKLIKYYDYKYFSNIEEIGCGGFGRVFRANWRNSEQYLALKSFFNFNNATIIKEIVREVLFKYKLLKILFILIFKFNINL